ncbi:AsnC family protein [Alloactinosynnema sp. L-07]|uniref:AsnC family protein n=1 Tax=Alloactinosynnema sp. L-07 TaxID=1653480 RepID=UPI001E6439E2|nr:AsnC family protein [Alloactinosynnema sp. L-07]
MTDAVDARVLGVVAEMGRAAVHEVAARLGMDPREVASRLVALSAAGLPLLVGVECDPNGIRAALARMGGGVQGTPSGVYPPPQGYPQQFPGPHQAQTGPPSQPFPAQPYPGQFGQGQPPMPGQPQYGQQFGGQGPAMGQQGQGIGQQGQGQVGGPMGHQVPSYPGQPMQAAPSQPVQVGPPSQPFPAVPEPISTWGPPQSSSWARGDQPPQDAMDRTQPAVRPGSRQGVAGSTLETEGLEGERIAIQLVEVVDPADYLFTAAGYRLQEGERSIVVHTEMTNRGPVHFATLPDMYLVLVTPEGKTISKAPVSLSSRPAYRIGVAPGETTGGHTVYVVPEDTEVTAVRWSPRPDEETRTLTWKVEN